ncbi:hypothetical protein FEM48_Zijuj12G0197200 [Ziziphus jujuba var. spinosa]|uniref:Uncharacterized protein n=1 Tax=Ziziphus jujuba var. spinosa TaxID=714518 RepID=A0A978UF69_ZIZJJ|nr:hypothetical protein FEM48_Zijuj12G0197200 [Ziziphus jujuba var. spinosa]
MDAIKTALLLGAIDCEIGGIAISGSRGIAKIVMARGLHAISPPIDVVVGLISNVDPPAKPGDQTYEFVLRIATLTSAPQRFSAFLLTILIANIYDAISSRDCLLIMYIMGYKIFTHEIHSSYAARLDNFRSHDTVRKDIIKRWTYPLVPGVKFFGNSSVKLER